ncbi:nodulation protein NfeD [Hydrogenophaga crassostreae]|uniref:Nodulation protein NfeD n=1 Tax=Hydrogenophaga crassostreae TaxID=1763535 RepID=A0A162SVR8_9BURK|nr:LysR family transcriptional regulator [Hydrogenophaga crassostreae]AOW12055.1 nodulation protein NfeD [Hydrogenophaga crassostreae]OAD40999.1 nodulation protein NfeD [Hydrogenophaga crassostreae]
MRFKNLDLNLLVALDALLTENNITRAAERVHLSQSAMSNALSRLRDYFNDPLLVQVGRTMEPTPRAEVLREAVHDLLLRIDTTVAALPEFDPTTSDREFTLFVSDYTMEILIPHVLAIASRLGSKVRFKLQPQSNSPDRALERGETDLLIIPKAYVSQEHPSVTLFKDEFVCIAWRDSQIARGELTPERYANAGHIVMRPQGTSQPAFEEWFIKRYGVSRLTQVSTYSFTAMPFLVIGTEMITTIHERLARRLVPSLPIKLMPIPVPMPALEQTMQWHKYRAQDPGLIWLRSLMQQASLAIDAPEASG